MRTGRAICVHMRAARTRGHAAAPSGTSHQLALLPERRAPTTLHVFDFDQTLVNTPDVETGKQQWLRLHGSPWPHAGWWGRPESLDARLTSTPGPALGAYRDAVADSTAVVVLLTGRRAHMAAGVALHAARHGCGLAHQVLLNDTPHETLLFKQLVLCRLVEQYSTVSSVHIYEDREPHAESFTALGTSPPFASLQWRVHLVTSPTYGGGGVMQRQWPRPRAGSEAAALPCGPADAAGTASAQSVASDEAGVLHLMADETEAPPSLGGGDAAPGGQPRRRASSGGETVQRALPHYELLHYLRLTVPLPEKLAAAVPLEWRAAKATRDGTWPPAHVTIITAAELKALGITNQAARAKLWTLVRQARTGPVSVVGLGCAVDAEDAAACAFAVVECPPARWLRRQLGLPPHEAHITLGFDSHDVHDVRKGRNALLSPPTDAGWGTGQAATAAMAAALQRRVKKLRGQIAKQQTGAAAA